MKQIDFVVAEKRYEYTVPEKWDELTADQFKLYVEHDGKIDVDFVRQLMAMDDVVAVSLTISDWWLVVHQFDWMTDSDGVRKLYMDEVVMPDGTTFYGYNADFSDVSWEEWTFADTYANAGRWDVVAAVLYRPQRPDWNHETDRRIPFTKYGTEKRMELTAKLDQLTMKAIQMNYILLRKRLTDHYTHLFYEAADDDGNGHRKKTKQNTDWLSLIRSMMGDNFYEEQKYLGLSVPSVLFQLESRVKEAKKNGK